MAFSKINGLQIKQRGMNVGKHPVGRNGVKEMEVAKEGVGE